MVSGMQVAIIERRVKVWLALVTTLGMVLGLRDEERRLDGYSVEERPEGILNPFSCRRWQRGRKRSIDGRWSMVARVDCLIRTDWGERNTQNHELTTSGQDQNIPTGLESFDSTHRQQPADQQFKDA